MSIGRQLYRERTRNWRVITPLCRAANCGDFLRPTAGFTVPYTSLRRRDRLVNQTLVQYAGGQIGDYLTLFSRLGVSHPCHGAHLPSTRFCGQCIPSRDHEAAHVTIHLGGTALR